MEIDFVLDGWREVGEADDALASDGDSLAIWIKGDVGEDFLRLVGLLCGEGTKDLVFEVRDRIFYASVYVKGGSGKADIFLTLAGDTEEDDVVYAKEKLLVSPEVLEMIEKAAVGDDEDPE